MPASVLTAPRVAQGRAAARPPRGAVAALAAALLGMFIVTLDAVVVNVALPSIRTDLGGGISGLQWVVDGYTLTFAALLLSGGSLSDRVGARRAFGFGVALFVLSSLGCAVQRTGAGSSPPHRRSPHHGNARRSLVRGVAAIRGIEPGQSREERAEAAWALYRRRTAANLNEQRRVYPAYRWWRGAGYV
jgi:hypothetical protein